METIINATPHAVKVVDDNGSVVKEFPPEILVRVSSSTEVIGTLAGVPISHTTYGDVEGLPEEAQGVYYIVSAMVRAALPDRKDLLVPSQQVRDDAGRVVGCKTLGR
jgi:hypothetical protein